MGAALNYVYGFLLNWTDSEKWGLQAPVIGKYFRQYVQQSGKTPPLAVQQVIVNWNQQYDRASNKRKRN